MREKTRILVLSTTPWTSSRFVVDDEAKEILERLQEGPCGDRFQLHNYAATRPSDLQKLLLMCEPHIVHFSGHRSRLRRILLGGTEGRSEAADHHGLANVFALYNSHVRLVLLNSCSDHTGRIAITPQFEKAFPFTLGLALVKIGRKYGYIDQEGKLVINPQFDTATPFSDEGIAGVRLGDKWGGIDKTGKVVINPQFDGTTLPNDEGDFLGEVILRDVGRIAFSEGLASVRIGNKAGYIDKSGNYVINPQFEFAFPFVGDLAFVMVGGGPHPEIGWIDKTGKFVWKNAS